MFHAPSPVTTTFIVVFLAVYLVILVRNAAREQIDVYDFILLTAVAAIPAIFTLLPEETWKLTQALGLEFPFLLMFGGIMLVAFVLMWRSTRRLARLRDQITRLAQEQAILQGRLEAIVRELAN